MPKSRQVPSYRTLPVPQLASLPEILTALRGDSLFTSWDAELPDFRKIKVLDIPGPCSVDETRSRTSEYFEAAQTVYKAFEDYKVALESAKNVPGISLVAELAHCNRYQEIVRQLVERLVDLHWLAHEASLENEPMHPDFCNAVNEAAAWLEKLWGAVVSAVDYLKQSQGKVEVSNSQAGNNLAVTNPSGAVAADDDVSSSCSFNSALSQLEKLDISEPIDQVCSLPSSTKKRPSEASSSWQRAKSVFRTLSQRLSQK